MDIKLLSDGHEDWDNSINWSLFAHTAQSNYAFARISMMSISPSSAVTLSHQMIELYVKAFILHSVCESDFDEFEKIRRKYGHDTPSLMEKYKEDIPVFKALLENEQNVNFINSVSKHYVMTRFGQSSIVLNVHEDCKTLDNIFKIFTAYFYNDTKVNTLLFLTIPSNTRIYFEDSEILDFTGDNCRQFGLMIGNIKIIIE